MSTTIELFFSLLIVNVGIEKRDAGSVKPILALAGGAFVRRAWRFASFSRGFSPDLGLLGPQPFNGY